MAVRFSLYYHSKENGEYLQKIINSTSQGLLVEAKDLDQLPAQANSGAEVVFLEYQEDHPRLDRWIEKAVSDPKGPYIFLYLKEISTASLWKAMRLGIKECFTFPIGEVEFQEALDRLPQALAAPEGQEATGFITFMGVKGGVGTTFLAANLAAILAREYGREVLMLDLDLHFNPLLHYFDAHPQHTIMDLIENFGRMDFPYMKGLFHPCGENLALLAGPARLEEAEGVTPEHLEKIMKFLKNLGFYRFILVDATSHLNDLALKALEFSDRLVLVAGQSIPALSNAKKLLELLELLDVPGLKIDVVLNAWDHRGALSFGEAKAYLGGEIWGTVPCDYREVGRSINEGRPLVQSHPRHPVCRELRGLAVHLAGEDLGAREPAGMGWMKRLLRRA